ncbi:hypothetical protein Nmel_008413 [Mimus melanotis]
MPHPWKCSKQGWMGLWQPRLVEDVPTYGRRIRT